METVSIRLDEEFAKDLEKAVKENRYSTKTEFIREAVRNKINDLEKQKALLRLELVYGAGKKKGRNITGEDIHKAGEEVMKELAKKFNVDL